ncbi:MAG: hypothetical protein R3A51_11895 [Nannocystaceae bacterium]|nr:hypothetical protein [Myxococcales bacterium]
MPAPSRSLRRALAGLVVAATLAGCKPQRAAAPTKPPAGPQEPAQPTADAVEELPGWQRHTATFGRFTVRMPSEGALELDRSPEGGLRAESAWVDLPGGSYHAGVVLHETALDPGDDPSTYFADRIQWFTQSSGGKVEAERTIHARGYPGIAAELEVPLEGDATGRVYVRVIRAGRYQYELVVIAREPDQRRVAEFFASFALAPELDAEVMAHYSEGKGALAAGRVLRARRAPVPAAAMYAEAAASGAYTAAALGTVRLWEGEMHDSAGASEQALAAYERAAELGVDLPVIRVRRAAIQLSRERYAEAMTLLDGMRSAGHDDAEIRRLRAIAGYGLAHAGAVDKARLREVLGDLDRALEEEPASARARAWRGVVRLELGDRPGAVSDWLRATSIDARALPEFAALLWAIGGELQPQAAAALAAAGERELGEGASARRQYLRARLVAELTALAGDDAGAVSRLRAALALRPDDPELHHRLGAALDVAGDRKGAAQAYERAFTLAPAVITIRNSHAWRLATSVDDALRDGARAIEVARPLLEEEYARASLVDTVAAAHAEAGQWAEAAATQALAIERLRVTGGDDEQIADFERRLVAYREHRAWREDPKTGEGRPSG